MKELKIIIAVLLILLPIWGIYRYVEAMSPVWTVAAAQQSAIDLDVARQDSLIDIQAHQERAHLITGVLQGLGTGVVVLTFIFGGVYAWQIYDKRRESWARAVDGTFALQTFSNGAVKWSIDPNKQLTGTTGFQVATGALGEFTSAAGPDRQLAYNLSVQKTRTTSAMMTGDSGPKYAAHAKLLAGAYDRNDMPTLPVIDDGDPLQLSVTPYQPLTLTDAFAQSTADSWLLGNGAAGACSFNVFDVCHSGLIGATRTGKTSSTALLMALNARNHGMHVIALDGADGVDWRPYGNLLEVQPTDYTTIGDQLNGIVQIHDRRMKAIKLAGVANIDELDYTMPSMFIILEEFGRTMQAYASASKKQYALTEDALSNLMRVSRKTGIYFLLIDQSLNGWSGEVKANIKDYIAYHLGGNQGAAFNAYDLHKLRPNGQFWNNGNVYEAWHTKAQADALLCNLQPTRTKLLIDSQAVIDGNWRTTDTDADTLTHDQGEGMTAQSTPPVGVSSSVSATSYQSKSVSSDVSTGVSSVSPKLTGKPVSKRDIELVRNTYALTNSARETARLLWGARNDSRVAWVKEIVQGEVMQ